MKRSRFVLRAGLILLVTGVVGAGLTYRSMSTRNLTHARTGAVRVPFGPDTSSPTAPFLPFSRGVYRLYLASGGDQQGGCPPDSAPAGLAGYGGIIDVLITDPGGEPRLNRSYGPWQDSAAAAPGRGWLLLDSLAIDDVSGSLWTAEVYACSDSAFAPPCPWEVFLLPPQEVEIGAYLTKGIILLIGFAALMLAGFGLIVAGGRRRVFN